MIKEVKIPDIGEKVESIQVVGILVKEGDRVEVDQGLIEVETNKAVVEIPSPEKGKVVEISVEQDDELKIGQVIARIEVNGSEKSEAVETESDEPDKETVDKETGKEETSREAKKEEPDRTDERKKTVGQSDENDKYKEVEKKSTPKAKKERAEEAAADKKPAAAAAPASPSVRRLARELGVDINAIGGSGPEGRIGDDDIKAYVRDRIKNSRPHQGSSVPAPELPDFSKWGEITRESITSLRGVIANTMSTAWRTVPHVTQFDEADITELERFRKKYGDQVKTAGGKLTITAILLKVLTAALHRFPRFNASIDLENKEIIYKKYINIAVAVDTDRGLVVPVIRDVDKKNIRELSVELTDIADRTRARKVKPEELEGGTFTVSNQGGIGGTNFTPIVYWPQVAILGVSRSRSHVEHIEGHVESRNILPLALSYDHRIIDGADAARFLSWVVDALEHPLLLNLEN